MAALFLFFKTDQPKVLYASSQCYQAPEVLRVQPSVSQTAGLGEGASDSAEC